MSEDCCTSDNNIMILACSGSSNVGQLSNQAAVELTQLEKDKNFNLERTDIDRIKAAVKQNVSRSLPTGGVTSPAGCGCKSCC